MRFDALLCAFVTTSGIRRAVALFTRSGLNHEKCWLRTRS